jgi:hypothetical protein
MIHHSSSFDSSIALKMPLINASSEAARFVDSVIKEGLQHFAKPKVESLVSDIEQLVKESQQSGHGETSSIDLETAARAIEFAYLLPWSLPAPEIAPDPDGEIMFDWIGPSRKMFSVSVNRVGRIAYAGRFGERSKVHGIEQLSDICPQEIARGIARATR